jgi:hypothetical protein
MATLASSAAALIRSLFLISNGSSVAGKPARFLCCWETRGVAACGERGLLEVLTVAHAGATRRASRYQP